MEDFLGRPPKFSTLLHEAQLLDSELRAAADAAEAEAVQTEVGMVGETGGQGGQGGEEKNFKGERRELVTM